MRARSDLYDHLPTTIFTVMSALAAEHGAINLGQGFPDTDGPVEIRRAAADALLNRPNQYAPMMGLPELRAAVAEADRRFYNLPTEPADVLVACASEGLFASFLGLLNPGDEVIVLEPYYDCYVPQIRAAGGTPVFVRLQPPDWSLSLDALRAAFSARTKLIVLNTPHNPAGKVFTADELSMVAGLLTEFDAWAVCDEVYEHMTFDGARHIPLATLPGMRERCIRIGSAGKSFSLTGWRIGYLSAPPALLKPIAAAHQYMTFAAPPALQVAVAGALRNDNSYFAALAAEMRGKRDILAAGLREAGFDVLPCAGTYFLTADFSALAGRLGFAGDDMDFCIWLTKTARVTAIPMRAFYAPESGPPPATLIRFCFAKREEVLADAIARLKDLPSLRA